MILEAAMLQVKPGEAQSFEAAFAQASPIIASMPGYVSHELQACLEQNDRYLLLVRWEKLEDHTVGFRGSEAYREWKRLLHRYYDPFPTVEHFRRVYPGEEPDGTEESAESLTLRALQSYIRSKDHRPELKHAYILKLFEEVGELAEAVRKEKLYLETGAIKGTIDEELYDVLYYVSALANVYGIDLERSFRLKEELNAAKYARPIPDSVDVPRNGGRARPPTGD